MQPNKHRKLIITLTFLAFAGLFLVLLTSNNLDLLARFQTPPQTEKISVQKAKNLLTIQGFFTHSHYDDFDLKRAQDIYTLQSSTNGKIEIKFPKNIPIPESGSYLKLNGQFSKPALFTINQIDELKPPKFDQPLSKGNRKILALLTYFEDVPQPDMTPTEFQEYVYAESKRFYLENSYNQLTLDTTDIIDWYQIEWEQEEIINENMCFNIETLAFEYLPEEVNFDQYDLISLIIPYIDCPYGGYATTAYINSRVIPVSVTRLAPPANDKSDIFRHAWNTLDHELGHNINAGHAQYLACPYESIPENYDEFSTDQQGCTLYEYGDPFSTMGSSGFHWYHNGPHMEKFGWFRTDNIATITKTGVYTLEPIEIADIGNKIIKIERLTYEDGTKEYLYIEYRQPIGQDIMPEWITTNVYQGALLHTHPKPTSTYSNSILINKSANPDPDNNWEGRYYTTLLPGETWIDPNNNVAITVLSATPEELTVKINFPGDIDFPDPRLPEIPNHIPDEIIVN